MPVTLRRCLGASFITAALIPVVLAVGLLITGTPAEAPAPAALRSEAAVPVRDFPRLQPMLTNTPADSSETEPTMVW
jgi:hypothetical protein